MEHKRIFELCEQAGAIAVGIAKVEDVNNHHQAIFHRWLAKGYCAGMDYMRNHGEIRRNPTNLLENAQSVIVAAFSYSQPVMRDNTLPLIAPYAYGKDYHRVLKRKLKPIVEFLHSQRYNSRICIDSAPIPERYWAHCAGIGELCDNGMIYIPEHGQEVFLAIILTDGGLPCAKWIKRSEKNDIAQCCTHCGKCSAACPTGALQESGAVDSRKCINYLTIEYHGQYDAGQQHTFENARKQRPAGFWVGCDICQRVCALNKGVNSTMIPEFLPSEIMMGMTPDKFDSLNGEEKEGFLSGSPLRRALNK